MSSLSLESAANAGLDLEEMCFCAVASVGSVVVGRRCSIEHCELIGAEHLARTIADKAAELALADPDPERPMPAAAVIKIDSLSVVKWIGCDNNTIYKKVRTKVCRILEEIYRIVELGVAVHLI